MQWKGLPPIEEDELKAKRKMMKDAPKGAEDKNLEEAALAAQAAILAKAEELKNDEASKFDNSTLADPMSPNDP